MQTTRAPTHPEENRSREPGAVRPDAPYLAAVAAALGLAVAAVVAPWSQGLSIWAMNFLYYWGPQAGVLLLLLAVTRRPAVLAGVAVALAGHLAVFALWMSDKPPQDALAWLYYFFSFPGALAGALAAGAKARRRPDAPALVAGAGAAALTLAGVAVNHVVTRLGS